MRSRAVLTALLAISPSVWAQAGVSAQVGVGCDGSYVQKAGRTGSCSSLALQIAAMLAEPSVSRAHWGIAVIGDDGAPIFSLHDGEFFRPASNAKLYTTAAAMALLGPAKAFETRVIANGILTAGALKGDLSLVGGGDANLSGRTLPYVSPGSEGVKAAPLDLVGGPPKVATDPLRYLRELADAVAATGLKTVSGDVIGDDRFFPYEPYPSDWTIEDAVWGFGAPVSALAINDNQIRLTVTPGLSAGKAATVTLDPMMDVGYYILDASVSTGPPRSSNTVHVERAIGSKLLRVYGSIAADAPPDVEEIAIGDPAEFAAQALKLMLVERGVAVAGVARARHRLPTEPRGFMEQVREPVAVGLLDGTLAPGCDDTGRPDLEPGEQVLATHQSAPLGEDVTVTNKVSQNLHAELFLHQLGKNLTCVGSTAQGARVVRSFLLRAGLDPGDFFFYDGSGLSGHDLVTPRATVRLLQYATGQPWFAAWKASLPIGGVDGGLAARFVNGPLKGKLSAKTGTLGETRALSGYMEAASGRMLIFSVMVDVHAPGSNADREIMDRVLTAIAAAE